MIIPLIYIAIAQSLFSAIVILTKKPLKSSDKILSAWLFIMIGMLSIFLVEASTTEIPSEKIMTKSLLISITFPSFLFLYVKHLVGRSDKLDFLHFIPVPILFFLFKLLRLTPLKEMEIGSGLKLGIVISLLLSLILIIFVYRWFTLRFIKNYQGNQKNLYSSYISKVDLKWLKLFVNAFTLLFISVIFSVVAGNFLQINTDYGYISVTILYTVFIYIVGFRGYRQVELLAQRNENKEKTSAYQNSLLKEQDANNYANKIIDVVEKERVWLIPEVTVKDLSIRTEIPQYYVTQVINEQLNKNFYTLINEYRAKEVIRLLESKKYENWTLTAIAFEAGFNSRTSFNTFFKKYTGKTPSEYKKDVA